MRMKRSASLADLLVAGGFVRPHVLWRGLQLGRPDWACWPKILLLSLSGVIVEPFAWLQSLLWGSQLRQLSLPPDPIVVIGHWRSGTTYLHQLLACDPTMATARNSLTVAPQVALLFRLPIRLILGIGMTSVRPIDAVPWGIDEPQEDELGVARLSIDTNMAGMAFPRCYPFHFRRSVLSSSCRFERQWLYFTRLTCLHEGPCKSQLLIKNSAHTARVALVLKHFPRARFILLQRDPQASIRSLVQVKQRLAALVGLQVPPEDGIQVDETVHAHHQLLHAFECDRDQIPDDQLLELSYEDLVRHPLASVERIYRVFQLPSWAVAEASIRKRVAQAAIYRADPVLLSHHAEESLQQQLAGVVAEVQD